MILKASARAKSGLVQIAGVADSGSVAGPDESFVQTLHQTHIPLGIEENRLPT